MVFMIIPAIQQEVRRSRGNRSRPTLVDVVERANNSVAATTIIDLSCVNPWGMRSRKRIVTIPRAR